MIFNSIAFIGFYACVLLFVLLLRRVKCTTWCENVLLLAASYWFYGNFNIAFLLCLVYITIVNFIGGIVLDAHRKKLIVAIIILMSLLPLVVFKYADFLLNNVLGLDNASMFCGWIVPLGISFYTFQALSYTIDLYRGKVSSERNIIDFSLFVAFFPTLLSGPIERGRSLIPQIKARREIDGAGIYSAVCMFSWGLFKKIVVADRLCTYVDSIYSRAEYYNSATLAFAAILYSIQIYCDFSGYSDMAVGVARGLGFNITQNFHFPYFATSIKEFWRRWHISLTSWFTEYVYFSLGGNRVKTKARWMFNISMIFLLSGIWHGAAWGFIIWGALHAVVYLAEHFCGIQNKGFNPSIWFKIAYAPLVFIMVTIAWVFFRAESFDLARTIVSRIFTVGGYKIATLASMFTFACNMSLLAVFIAAELVLCNKKQLLLKPVAKECALVAVWLMIALFSVSGDSFVYFQF